MVLSFSSALRKAQTLRGPQSGQARCGRTAAWRWRTVLGEGGYLSSPGHGGLFRSVDRWLGGAAVLRHSLCVTLLQSWQSCVIKCDWQLCEWSNTWYTQRVRHPSGWVRREHSALQRVACAEDTRFPWRSPLCGTNSGDSRWILRGKF